jgi:hypothetical protein
MPLVYPSAKGLPTPEGRTRGRTENPSLKQAQGLTLPSLSRDSTLGPGSGTTVPFANFGLAFIFASGQFWGRAARAPRSRKRLEALFIWRVVGLRCQILGFV